MTVAIPASTKVSMTLNQLSEILQSPYRDLVLQPYYEDALNKIMLDLYAGQPEVCYYGFLLSFKLYSTNK